MRICRTRSGSKGVRLLLITQDDPLFITDSIKSLITELEKSHEVVACIILSANPFGKSDKFINKLLKILKIFGVSFFCYLSLRFIYAKLFKSSLSDFLQRKAVPKIFLDKSINHADSLSVLKRYEPDLLISVAGNEIFKPALFTLAEFGCLNLHTALLPKYRGLMPTFWALKNAEKEIGVSVFLVDEGIDSGPIVVQRTVKIERRILTHTIAQTKKVGVECICEAVDLISHGETDHIPNDDEKSTYFGFPSANDVRGFKQTGARLF